MEKVRRDARHARQASSYRQTLALSPSPYGALGVTTHGQQS